MNDLPNVTPPAHVHLLTLEEVQAEVRELRKHDAETFAELRRLGERLEELSKRDDDHHLVVVSQLGALARMLRDK